MNAASTPIKLNASSAAAPTERQSSSGLRKPERFERFDLERSDDLAVADDGLAALEGLLDGRDGLAGVLLRAQRGVAIQHQVAAHEALDQLDDDGAIGIGEERADAQRDVAADLVDAVVGDAVLQDVLQDALGFVGDRSTT